ncbi:hypothetical protein [Aliivibrio salmonicida]|uniref:hypothetical protein n=1 Tax=Aliivibrio salmonicida TaxID=40269 RepID=UPI003D14C5D0
MNASYWLFSIGVLLVGNAFITKHTINKEKRYQKRIDELEEMNEKLLLGDLGVKSLAQDMRGNTDIELSGSVLHLFAASFISQFRGHGATNYLEVSFVDREENQQYTLLMQKKSGLTPSEKNAVLTKEIEELKEKLNEK